MSPADKIGEFVFDKYVQPALDRGARDVTIKASDACDALGGAYSLDLVTGVLGSMRFRNTYRLALESTKIEGEDTTFRFRLDVGWGAGAAP